MEEGPDLFLRKWSIHFLFLFFIVCSLLGEVFNIRINKGINVVEKDDFDNYNQRQQGCKDFLGLHA